MELEQVNSNDSQYDLGIETYDNIMTESTLRANGTYNSFDTGAAPGISESQKRLAIGLVLGIVAALVIVITVVLVSKKVKEKTNEL